MDVTLTLNSSEGTLDIDPGSAQLTGAMALARLDDPAGMLCVLCALWAES